MKRRPPRWSFPIVKIEFFAAAEEAVERRLEMIDHWDFAEYESMPIIPKRKAWRMRRETKRAMRSIARGDGAQA